MNDEDKWNLAREFKVMIVRIIYFRHPISDGVLVAVWQTQ